MHSLWSVCESAPVPHSDTCGVTIDNDHRCFPFPVHGKLDEVGVYGEQSMLAGKSPRAGGVFWGAGSVPGQPTVDELQKKAGGVR